MAPSVEHSTWFKLHDVALANGDQVGAIAPWAWPDAFEGISTADLRRCQMAIDDGKYRSDSQAKPWVGDVIARTLGLDPEALAIKARVKTILAAWIRTGALIVVDWIDPEKNWKRKRVVTVGEWAIKGEF